MSIGPYCGYRTDTKRSYRQEIYNRIFGYYFGRGCFYWCKNSYNRKIFLLPSIEGEEIDFILGHKIVNVNDLVICDKNPAIAASISRKFPGIRAYGVDAAAALCREMKRQQKDYGAFMFINLDLCGTVWESVRIAAAIHDKCPDVLSHESIIAFTFLNGRDPAGRIPKMILNCGLGYYFRINAIIQALQFGRCWNGKMLEKIHPYKVGLRDHGKYLSHGRIPFGWCMLRIRRDSHKTADDIRWNHSGESSFLVMEKAERRQHLGVMHEVRIP